MISAGIFAFKTRKMLRLNVLKAREVFSALRLTRYVDATEGSIGHSVHYNPTA
jgi:hypothetical protein